ncbi:MAG: hypothetical protein GYA22_07285, partial [Bacteroidales bacterium]|nr:hypothetical protein [Bacteroidales bacterium]
FHMLVCGIYGIEKSREGILVSAPDPIPGVPFTELLHVCWRNAVYNFHWEGKGSRIVQVLTDGHRAEPVAGKFLLDQQSGEHEVKVLLEK